MHRVAAKFVPRILTANRKQQLVDVCAELRQLASDGETPDFASFDFFTEMKLKPKGCWFDNIEEIQAESQRAVDTDRKGLPGSVPKMEETVGPVSTCGRELLRGRWESIGLAVSFMIFTASARTILGTTSYISN
jgi:hypothetical protein